MQVLTDRRCLQHRPGGGYPERPERLSGIVAGLAAGGFPAVEDPGFPDAREQVEAVHPRAYVERFRRAVERGDGLLDSADNPLAPGTWEAAWGAVETSLAAAQRAVRGEAVFAAVRPPGHHAERETAMGFCYFANAAIVAQWLRTEGGCPRVAIFDFDVHHGNGTQHIFEEDPDVFYVSTHQFPFYPGTGAADERGRGPGEGATLNVPLPAGSDDTVWDAAIEGTVLPALREHRPDALVVSAGFDAWRRDPLGGMAVSEEAFGRWGGWLRALADETSGGRLVALLEGGYDLDALPRLATAFVRGLAGGPEGGPR